MHFFEALEREIRFQTEYEKIEKMMVLEKVGNTTLERWVSDFFRDWKDRGSYISFKHNHSVI